MNFYKHHIGDYDKETVHLTACADGIYGRLLRRYYDTEQPLPSDTEAVQRLVRARSREEREAVETVLAEFFNSTDEGWRHRRCDEGIEQYNAKRDKAKRSAKARWNGCERNANAMRTQCDGNANAMRTHANSPEKQELKQELKQKQEQKQKQKQELSQKQNQELPPSAAQIDPIKDLIDGGVEYLGECGIGPRQARSVIGLIRKTVSDDFVAAELLAVAQRDRVADPVAWLRKAAARRAAAGALPSLDTPLIYIPLPGEI